MKKNFTLEDYERAFGSGSYRNEGIFIDTFGTFFRRNPPATLDKMSHDRLEGRIARLKNSERVRKLREILAEEVVYGENNLLNLITITLGELRKLRIAPQDKNKIYSKKYQDVWAYCAKERGDKRKSRKFDEPAVPIAKGLFEMQIPLEKIFFRPENTFYSNLPTIYSNGVLECGQDCKDVVLRRAGSLYVFSDRATDEELESRVKTVIGNTADRIHKNIQSKQKRHDTAEHEIIDGLYKMFKSLKTGSYINYPKVYKIFNWIARENFDISHLISGSDLRKVLRQEIDRKKPNGERIMPLPYAAIRTRVKESYSEFLKVLLTLYDIRINKDDDNNKPRLYQDRNGLRIIVPTEQNVMSLVKSFNEIPTIEITHSNNNIGTARESGYRSYDLKLKMGDSHYDLQVRTHQMDRNAEMDKKQAHEGEFQKAKIEALKIVPYPVKLAVAAVYGI